MSKKRYLYIKQSTAEKKQASFAVLERNQARVRRNSHSPPKPITAPWQNPMVEYENKKKETEETTEESEEEELVTIIVAIIIIKHQTIVPAEKKPTATPAKQIKSSYYASCLPAPLKS